MNGRYDGRAWGVCAAAARAVFVSAGGVSSWPITSGTRALASPHLTAKERNCSEATSLDHLLNVF
jgi:hypothetical protein